VAENSLPILIEVHSEDPGEEGERQEECRHQVEVFLRGGETREVRGREARTDSRSVAMALLCFNTAGWVGRGQVGGTEEDRPFCRYTISCL
jgi:hypothetical protein